MLNGPFSPWPSFTEEEADAVRDVVLSGKVNYWTGTQGREFEKEFAVFAGSEYAIAIANGTVALDLAWQGLGIGAHYGGNIHDEVIVSSRSFMASASSIANAGARPVFADVDLNSGNLMPETVEKLIGPNTRAILCVHLSGWPCDMDELRNVIGDRNIALVEDCAQAHGALYKGKPVGGLGDVAAWSFCQDKIMTTGGEGGMVTCNDRDLWKKMWSFKDHGKSWDAVYERDHPPGFRWLHESFGTNWRLTEMQSAIGRIQLGRMPAWQAAREANAARLTKALEPFDKGQGVIRIPIPQGAGCNGCGSHNIPIPQGAGCNGCGSHNTGCRNAWYKYYTYVRPESLANGWTRDRIVTEITKQGVPAMQGSCSELYLEKAFEGTSFRPEFHLPNARALGETSLMFLVHPTLTSEETEHSCATITDVLMRASK